MPFMVSLPITSYLSDPTLLNEVDAKRATGNFAVSNQFELLISVSDSSLARSMLPRSISNSAFDFARSFGRKTTLAFHLRKRPSTLTPICFETKRISLLSMSSPCAPDCPAASSSIASDGMKERSTFISVSLPGACASARGRGQRSDVSTPPRCAHRPERREGSSTLCARPAGRARAPCHWLPDRAEEQ